MNISCSVFSYTCQDFLNFIIINKEYIPPRSVTQHMILNYSEGSKCRASDVIHKCLTNRQVFLRYQNEKRWIFFPLPSFVINLSRLGWLSLSRYLAVGLC